MGTMRKLPPTPPTKHPPNPAMLPNRNDFGARFLLVLFEAMDAAEVIVEEDPTLERVALLRNTEEFLGAAARRERPGERCISEETVILER
jgi:hypothetical protein